MNFFTKNGGRGARVSDFFFTNKSNLKKTFGGGAGGLGRGRWMDRRTGPNQNCSFNFFEVGGITMH